MAAIYRGTFGNNSTFNKVVLSGTRPLPLNDGVDIVSNQEAAETHLRR